MHIEHVRLINQSIAGLQRLADVFAAEAIARQEAAEAGAPQTAKEALLTIRVLLPKLEAARALLHRPAAPPIRCVGCED
jgi:hypothetical protein